MAANDGLAPPPPRRQHRVQLSPSQNLHAAPAGRIVRRNPSSSAGSPAKSIVSPETNALSRAKQWILSSQPQPPSQPSKSPEILYMGRVINADELVPPNLNNHNNNTHKNGDSQNHQQRGTSAALQRYLREQQQQQQQQQSTRRTKPRRFTSEDPNKDGPPSRDHSTTTTTTTTNARRFPPRSATTDLSHVRTQRVRQQQPFHQRALPARAKTYSPDGPVRRPPPQSIMPPPQQAMPRSLSDRHLGAYAKSVRKLKYSRDELHTLMDDPQEFAKLKASLQKRGAVTNETLRQGLHFYVKANRDRKEKQQQQKQQQPRRRQRPSRTQSASAAVLKRRPPVATNEATGQR